MVLSIFSNWRLLNPYDAGTSPALQAPSGLAAVQFLIDCSRLSNAPDLPIPNNDKSFVAPAALEASHADQGTYGNAEDDLPVGSNAGFNTAGLPEVGGSIDTG